MHWENQDTGYEYDGDDVGEVARWRTHATITSTIVWKWREEDVCLEKLWVYRVKMGSVWTTER